MGPVIHPTAVIERDVHIGGGTTIWHFVHVREQAWIGMDCHLGRDVFIDAQVVIGDRCKIQNGVSLYRGLLLEDEVFIGPHAVFTNDLYPRAIGDWTLEPTRICHGASIGANATILCGIVIGPYAMVGAGAVVTEDVPSHGLVRGNPARLVGYVGIDGRPLAEKPIDA